jgi:hypothetical protein
MKRFVAFSFDNYYPGGGMYDCVGVFGTLDAARTAARAKNRDFAQVWDRKTDEVHDWHVSSPTWTVEPRVES